MAVMVDPPQRDSADERSAQTATAELRTITTIAPAVVPLRGAGQGAGFASVA